MSKDTQRILLALISLFLPFIGIVLYFVYKPKKDARLFGLLGIVSILLWGFGVLNLF